MAKATDRREPGEGAGRKVKWDDKELAPSHANVCNVSSTPDEVTLLFGIHEAGRDTEAMGVRLTARIILSPYAARRLAQVIGEVTREYEKRVGKARG